VSRGVTVLAKTSDTRAQLGAAARRSAVNASNRQASLETSGVTVAERRLHQAGTHSPSFDIEHEYCGGHRGMGDDCS